MTRLAPAILFLGLNLVAFQPTKGADQDPSPASRAPGDAVSRGRDMRERWNLRLVPDKCPEIDAALLDGLWSVRAPRDILGRGTDRFIRVSVPRDTNDARSIVFTTVRHYGVNARVQEVTTTTTHPLTFGGPFLEYDGLLHTAFLSREVFIPDAVLKVAERKWYAADARRTAPAKAGDGEAEVMLTEYLFEFDDDPIEAARGKLTLHRHVRKASKPAGEVIHYSAIFVRVRHEPDEREPYELQILTPEQRSLTVWFYSGRPYALWRDRQSVWSEVYRPERAVP